MKKIITMLLIGLMVVSSTIVAFAEEPGDTSAGSALKEKQMAERFNLKKEFTEEIHQINALRTEKNQLQILLIEKQDQLVDLYIEAREIENSEALKAAKEERNQIKRIHEEIKTLHEEAAEVKEAYREAVKNNDVEAASAEIEKLMSIHNSINDKIEEKIEVMEKIIDILS